MSPKAGYSTPMYDVANVGVAIRFYEQLGFATIDTEGEGGHLGWARLECKGGAIMLLEAESPRRAPGGGLYMYTDDLTGLRAQLIASGVAVSPIGYPVYMPSGEFRVADPDGHVVLVGHWGRTEQEAWERRLAEKRKARGE
jgi:hypothetical protein